MMIRISLAVIAICLAAAAPARAEDAICKTSSNPSAAESLVGPSWNGWGATLANTRFQAADAAGLSAADVPKLKLKWAFGFPNTKEASAQPAVVGGRVYVGSFASEVYSLDAKTGCVYWVLKTEAVVRSAVTLSEASGGALVAHFGDQAANVYAVDAVHGTVLWKVKVENHPLAKITGSPTLYNHRLYVPVASGEENAASMPSYECCTFRGSIVALDAATGHQIWKTYTIPDVPRRTGKTPADTDHWGPSGAAVWNSPTIDVKQKLLYVGTGNSYSEPAGKASDAIVAFDLESGKIKWANQLIKDDTWNTSCQPRVSDHSNCPDRDDPDFDFGASPMLLELRDGRRMIVAGQKSGLVYGLDPDRKGKLVWTARVDNGGTQGGVMWGPAADGDSVYVAISGALRVGTTSEFDPTAGGGIVALNAVTGQKIWGTPAQRCRQSTSCSPAQAAAVTGIPGVVFSGSADGHLRAYSTKNGMIIWDYDAVREFPTVNGVKGNGGTLNHGGAAVVGGMVFANSGYNHITGIYPGNVLLAFSVE